MRRHSRHLLTMEPRPQMTWWGRICKHEEPVHQKMLEDGCFFICLCPWATGPQCTFSFAFSGTVAECKSSPFCLLSLEWRIVSFVLYFISVGTLFLCNTDFLYSYFKLVFRCHKTFTTTNISTRCAQSWATQAPALIWLIVESLFMDVPSFAAPNFTFGLLVKETAPSCSGLFQHHLPVATLTVINIGGAFCPNPNLASPETTFLEPWEILMP